MNTLNQIKKQILKRAALHDAQIHHTSYRGVEYDTRCVESKETHGTFCYRGRTYTKSLPTRQEDGRMGVKTPIFLWKRINLKRSFLS